MHEENKYILDEKNQLEQILLDNPLKHNDHKKQIDDLKEKLYIVETCKLYEILIHYNMYACYICIIKFM